MGLTELIVVAVQTFFVMIAHALLRTLTRKKSIPIYAFYGIPAIFLAGALMTPPDLLSMLIVAMPVSLLYLVVIAVWILRRQRQLN
ncbi:MAG: hypothetical protein IH624_01855 [Phycisphaerae bacterium]|nr:hypothetical protein [Phycisphaerae bacterium]